MNLTLKNIKLALGEFTLDCSLNLPSGKLITLLGPSGCGKTSLLKSIAGLYPLDRGTISLGDRDITNLDSRFRKVGMVFQDYALFPHMSVEKNICYGMNLKNDAARKRSDELLEMVELPGFGTRMIEELSGGEKQRVALARALASDPDLLLLDEPLSALDARLRRVLRRQIREIQLKTGITTLYVTHDQEEAMAISDLVVLMKDGRVCQTGSPREIYTTPAHRFAGEFFGSANLIPLGDCSHILDGFDPSAFPGGPDFPEDSYLFFRPEDCRILSAEDSPIQKELSGTGKILYEEYGGDFHYLEIKSGSLCIKIKTKSPEKLQDSEIRWMVRPEDCLILGDD
ncbi:ABC transporter ATP-binding protein [Oceanispirochaeta crateris]|uniref:ABC transporter ATP-binding protein n=1 Tax=Oceanispirochaeta crateris TaxID=2518645 RepID=A0A5C1QRC8_9SPIO|nr:ABC transporter ATP-binding protein [Oceanispirochaeta crateris]QEN08632.1 ABC transporter ATP-binding protein [Oceanispirochaeta crateris]